MRSISVRVRGQLDRFTAHGIDSRLEENACATEHEVIQKLLTQ